LKALAGCFCIINFVKPERFLSKYRTYNNMDYKNNDPFENNGSALIVFITLIAVALSLLGIIVCIL
jgi:hypothetical protein